MMVRCHGRQLLQILQQFKKKAAEVLRDKWNILTFYQKSRKRI